MGACCSKCKGRRSRCYKRKKYAVNPDADDIKSSDQEAVALKQVDGLSAEGIVVEKTEEVRQCRRTSSDSSSSSSCSGSSQEERKKSIARNISDSGSCDDESQPRNMSIVSDNAPLLGMHIDAIRRFIRRHPEIAKQRLSTSDINRSIVKPGTHGTKRPFIAKYVGKKSKSGVSLVAPATVFISHAWRYEFVSVVVDVMEQHAKKRPRSYFWFDLFTNDQNAISSRDFDWFSNTFRNSIRSIGQVLLVLSPWNDPMPIRRAWCLFEIATALEDDDNVDLSIYLPESEIQAMEAAVVKQSDCLIETLSDIQAEKAEAKTAADRDMIFSVIRESEGGFDAVNEHVKTSLRAWYVSQLRQLVFENPDDMELKMAVAENCLGLFSQQSLARVNTRK